jgi:hypothetical protein
MSLLQFVNIFLMHSWLASAPPFTPVQNANLLVSISSCANPELLPMSELAKACAKPTMASADHPQVVSFDTDR